MDKKLNKLIKFIERAKGLELREKIKLILFLDGVKPNAEVILKIDPKNLGDKFELEKLLKDKGVIFLVSRARSYEEIKKIKGNKVIWEIAGTYYIYDLFKGKKEKERFKKYLELLKKGKRAEGNRIVGEQYGYPRCCVSQFVKEMKTDFLKKTYSYWTYYKKQQDLDRKFPFIFHRACKVDCEKSEELNKKYEEVLKKRSKKIWKEYKGKNKFKGELIVGEISDVEISGKSIWLGKEGYEYELIFRKPLRRHYYLVSWLSQQKYKKGQVLKGIVELQYDYAKVKMLKEKKKIISGLIHERKLPLLGEVEIK